MTPFVSILIPCYNAQRWVGQAIESALLQTWAEKEVIVVDDGSTDRSLDIIKSFGDRIKWETGPNRGGNAARNLLLNLAQGDWLQYLDADDYLVADKVQKQAEFLATHPDVDILLGPVTMEHWREDGVEAEVNEIPPLDDMWILLARWFMPGTGSGIWRKRALIEVGNWDEKLRCCQEHELYLRLLMAGRQFKRCPHGGYVYRQWSEQTVCKRNKTATHCNRLAILRRLEIFLRERGALNSERAGAINQGRFETVRSIWPFNQRLALNTVEIIRRSQPNFWPSGDAAPPSYRLVYRLFGLSLAENLARMKRSRGFSLCFPHFSPPAPQLLPANPQPKMVSFAGRPLVSILIPCYNAEQWIKQSIDSALAQTWPEKEVIVVDDGSTDHSLEIIKKFSGRIRWETGPNRGGNVARNRLLELSRGEWLQYLDADDYLAPNKVANQILFLSSTPPTDLVFGPVTMEYVSIHEPRQAIFAIPKPHDPWILLARWYLPQTGASLWRKSAIRDVGGWKTDQPCCQEHELYLRLLMAGKRLAFCPLNGAVYRQWSELTVCKRDKSEVHRQRLQIEKRAEEFLRNRGELTGQRQQAINQARFEIARLAWLYDQVFAEQIMEIIRKTKSGFNPSGEAAPSSYRLIYRLLGFQPAERLGIWRRRLIRAPR
jgi:glycosyltransferase involved in cell wall biosynthesis